MTVFKLRIDHNRPNYHLHLKLRIVHTEQDICCSAAPLYELLRKGIWSDHTPVANKLYESLEDLRCTTTSMEETGVSI